MSVDGLASREFVGVVCAAVAFAGAVIVAASYAYLSFGAVLSSVAAGIAAGCSLGAVDGVLRWEWFRAAAHACMCAVCVTVAVATAG